MQEELNSAMAEVPRPQLLDEPGREQPMEKEWKTSNQEALRQYELNVRFLHRGCIVQVGCKSIAFEDVGTAIQAINDYVCGDTYEEQQKWLKLLNS
jgi:hypothetical protein